MVLLFYLTAAVIWDFTTFRIPNYFIFFGLILGASLLPFRGYGIQEILLGCLCPVVFLYRCFVWVPLAREISSSLRSQDCSSAD